MGLGLRVDRTNLSFLDVIVVEEHHKRTHRTILSMDHVLVVLVYLSHDDSYAILHEDHD